MSALRHNHEVTFMPPLHHPASLNLSWLGKMAAFPVDKKTKALRQSISLVASSTTDASLDFLCCAAICDFKYSNPTESVALPKKGRWEDEKAWQLPCSLEKDEGVNQRACNQVGCINSREEREISPFPSTKQHKKNYEQTFWNSQFFCTYQSSKLQSDCQEGDLGIYWWSVENPD